MAKILVIGDIMGRPGRHALAQVLPMWKEEFGLDPKIDVIIGNVENLAHGRGVTPNTIKEMDELGFDVYTGGNHIFDTGPHSQAVFDSHHNILRPQNYNGNFAGVGYYRFAKNGQQFLVFNLSGTVYMDVQERLNITNAFLAFDELFKTQAQKDDIIIVDLHAEATGEKVGLGWYADGRATVVYGTHTHVMTADERILPKGTAFITDVGMTGAKDSVLGIEPKAAMSLHLEGKLRTDFQESGPVIVCALLVETEGNKVIKITRLQKEVHVESTK